MFLPSFDVFVLSVWPILLLGASPREGEIGMLSVDAFISLACTAMCGPDYVRVFPSLFWKEPSSSRNN